MWTEEFQAIQKNFLYYKYQNMQDCSKIVTPESWHLTYQAWRLLLAGIFSTCECGFTQWRSTLASCLTVRLPCLLLFITYLFVRWNEFAFFRVVRFPKFVKTVVLLWKPWPAVDLKISQTTVSLSEPSVNHALDLRSLQVINRHMIVWIGWVPSIPYNLRKTSDSLFFLACEFFLFACLGSPAFLLVLEK